MYYLNSGITHHFFPRATEKTWAASRIEQQFDVDTAF
ncbi:Uncharacterised protein [Vibrio cholerae]|nr:Uncharacterised protein [Vibrio cholerae]